MIKKVIEIYLVKKQVHKNRDYFKHAITFVSPFVLGSSFIWKVSNFEYLLMFLQASSVEIKIKTNIRTLTRPN